MLVIIFCTSEALITSVSKKERKQTKRKINEINNFPLYRNEFNQIIIYSVPDSIIDILFKFCFIGDVEDIFLTVYHTTLKFHFNVSLGTELKRI